MRGEILDEVQGYWDKLSDGASIVESLTTSAWSNRFGMLTDSFGVTWILDVAAAYNAEQPPHQSSPPLDSAGDRSGPPR